MQIADALTVEGAITATGSIIPGGPTINPVSTVAAAGATQGAATAIPTTAAVVNITATTSSEGVKLPTAQTGKGLLLVPPLTKGVKTYGGAAGQLINANTTATTAYSLVSGLPVQFTALDATHWRATPATDPGVFTTLNATGLATLSGGGTYSGAQKETVTPVAAAGATQGTATVIGTGVANVVVSATTSSEGVRLPTAATSRVVTLIPPNTLGVKVYGGAAGQLINTATTATTAYQMSSGKPVTFFGVDATHWRALSPSSLAATTLALSGLATLSGGVTINGQQKGVQATVKATGNSVANARTVGTTTSMIVVNATASTEGVKLPTPSTGLQVTIMAPTAVGVLVYASAAGQSIGAGTTNTVGFAVTKNTTTTFYAVSTTKWRVSVA